MLMYFSAATPTLRDHSNKKNKMKRVNESHEILTEKFKCLFICSAVYAMFPDSYLWHYREFLLVFFTEPL